MFHASRLGDLTRAVLFLCVVFGLKAQAHAFTLITLDHPVVIVSKGEPGPASGASSIENRPRNSVSEVGCFVVFTSLAKNLTPTQNDANSASDVFLYNCLNGTTRLVSHRASDPDRTASGKSDQPVISPDGKFVVFRSDAPDIVPGTGFIGQTNVFLWDVDLDTFTLVSHATAGATVAGNGNSLNGVVSRTTVGRPIVAFESVASNLVSGDDNDASDVFRFDSGVVDLISVPNSGLDRVANKGSFHPDINGPGTCIVYESDATNLVSPTPDDDLNDATDVFRWNIADEPANTILLSHVAGALNSGLGAETGGGESTEPSIDDGCERFAFKSSAKDLAPSQADSNTGTDVFHEGNGGDAVLVSHQDGASEKTGTGTSDSPIISRDGKWVAYASLAPELAPGQNDPGGPTSDVFLFDIVGDKTLLVSHLAGDEKTVAGAESFLPEISKNGQYVAYVSKAKDIDPNQNDGNGEEDVFLYNRQWNNSIVASRRYASIAITGNRRSFAPALSGNGYFVAFTSEANNLIADDPDTSPQTDVFVFLSILQKPILTARSTINSNTLEWVTPAVNYLSMRMFVTTAACPTNFAGASLGIELFPGSPQGNTRAQFTHIGLGPNASYCYSIFIENDDATGFGPSELPWRTTIGRTFSNPTGTIRWAFNPAGTAALTQVGIGTQNHLAVANDGGVYGFTRGPAGGFWAGSSWPFLVSDAIQGRPPIVGFSTLGAARTTFVGSQDGRTYAFDADRVALAGGALWYTTPKLGALVQPGASGMFTLFGGLANHILIGARTGAAATFYALDASNGSVRSSYDFGPTSIGAISTAASVDYGASRVYFASFTFSSDDPSLWCLNLTPTGFGGLCWSQTLPDSISGGPVQRSGKVYVGDESGEIWAFDSATGSSVWPTSYSSCGNGAVKGYVLADRQGTGQDLYYSAGSLLCGVTDQGTSPVAKWGAVSLPGGASPSTPLLARISAATYLYVGGSDGRLYQIDTANPSALGAIKSVQLSTATTTIGPPALDVFDNMIYVGSEAGVIYAVQAPIP